MKFLLLAITVNAVAFGALAYPAMLWHPDTGVAELATAVVTVVAAFIVSFFALYKQHGKAETQSTAVLGGMAIRMGLMLVMFYAAPKLTGLETTPVVLWMVALYFVNLAFEAGYLVRIVKKTSGVTTGDDA